MAWPSGGRGTGKEECWNPICKGIWWGIHGLFHFYPAIALTNPATAWPNQQIRSVFKVVTFHLNPCWFSYFIYLIVCVQLWENRRSGSLAFSYHAFNWIQDWVQTRLWPEQVPLLCSPAGWAPHCGITMNPLAGIHRILPPGLLTKAYLKNVKSNT